MASDIIILDAANLFMGDDDPSNSQHLTLKSAKMPTVEEKTKEHTPGGGFADLTLGMRSFSITPMTFQLEGFNPDAVSRFMPVANRTRYTLRGNTRSLRTSIDTPIIAVIEGRMTKMEMSEFKKDDGLMTDYEIKEIIFFSLHYGTTEKLYFDILSGPRGLRIDGVNPLAALAANLGL